MQMYKGLQRGVVPIDIRRLYIERLKRLPAALIPVTSASDLEYILRAIGAWNFINKENIAIFEIDGYTGMAVVELDIIMKTVRTLNGRLIMINDEYFNYIIESDYD